MIHCIIWGLVLEGPLFCLDVVVVMCRGQGANCRWKCTYLGVGSPTGIPWLPLLILSWPSMQWFLSFCLQTTFTLHYAKVKSMMNPLGKSECRGLTEGAPRASASHSSHMPSKHGRRHGTTRDPPTKSSRNVSKHRIAAPESRHCPTRWQKYLGFQSRQTDNMEGFALSGRFMLLVCRDPG